MIASAFFRQGAYLFFTMTGTIAAMTAAYFLRYPEKQHGLTVKFLAIPIIAGALIGAKIPIWISYGFDPVHWWAGKSLLGAILGAYLALRLFKCCYGIVGAFGDRYVIPLALGSAFGKIGCYFYGCCGGIAAHGFFAVRDVAGHMVYPTQLIESGFQFLTAFFFLYCHRAGKLSSRFFATYMVMYLSFRFCIEYIRTEPKLLLGMSVYQVLALMFVPWFMYELSRRNHDLRRMP